MKNLATGMGAQADDPRVVTEALRKSGFLADNALGFAGAAEGDAGGEPGEE